MEGGNMWRKSLLRMRSRRMRKQGTEELDYLEKIMDDNQSIESLKHDKQFWKLLTTSQEFRKTIIEALVSCKDGENVPLFLGIIFIKTVENDLTNDFHQMIYFEFIGKIVEFDEPAILQELLEKSHNIIVANAGEEIFTNCRSLVHACMSDNFEIVKVFVKHGFHLRCPSVGILSSEAVKDEPMNDEVYKLYILRAMSRPCYIMACYITVQERSSIRATYSRNVSKVSTIKSSTSKISFGTMCSKHSMLEPQDEDFQADPNCSVHYECNDPILRCFSLMNAAKDRYHSSPEYKEEYQEIVKNAEKFSTEILSNCSNSKEVELLLSEQVGASHVLRNASKMTFPRLRMAVETGQKEFVGHIYSQQVLSQQWIGKTNWDKKSNLFKALHLVIQMIFTPVFCIAYISKTIMKCYRKKQGCPKFFDDFYLFNSLDAPINRCISHTTTLAIILWLIIDAVFHPLSGGCISLTNDKIYTMKKSKIALIIMISACVFKEIEDVFSVRSFKIFLNFDFWRIYRSINHWIIIIALTIQIHLELRLSNDPALDFETEAKVANSMFALAATISMMHSLYWLQLHAKMGPIVISVSKIVMDVITISSMYIIVLISFSSGIMFILGTEKITSLKCRRTLNATVETLEDDISHFTETFETMFWSWLGPGQEFKTSDGTDLVSSRGVFAIVLMGIYQTISAVIIMNLLIAIMNSTVQNVQDKKLLYWKFVRAGFWIRFFDENRALPPPYNLLHIFGYIYSFVQTKLINSQQSSTNNEKANSSIAGEKRAQHRELMFDLLQRYTEQGMEIKREKYEERVAIV